MILATSRGVRVYAYPEPVDLRNGYDGLFGLVKQGLRRDPLGGDLFLFVKSSSRQLQVLVWDGTGLCTFQKRLERGRFASPWRESGDVVRMTASELALFIERCDLVGRRPLSPAALVPVPAGAWRHGAEEKRALGIDTGVMDLQCAAPDPGARLVQRRAVCDGRVDSVEDHSSVSGGVSSSSASISRKGPLLARELLLQLRDPTPLLPVAAACRLKCLEHRLPPLLQRLLVEALNDGGTSRAPHPAAFLLPSRREAVPLRSSPRDGEACPRPLAIV